MAHVVKIPNLVTRWRHLHKLQIWSLDGTTCISYTCIATLPWIVLLTLSVSIELVSSSARVTSAKFQQHSSLTHLLRDNQTHRSDQVYLGPIKTSFAYFMYLCRTCQGPFLEGGGAFEGEFMVLYAWIYKGRNANIGRQCKKVWYLYHQIWPMVNVPPKPLWNFFEGLLTLQEYIVQGHD